MHDNDRASPHLSHRVVQPLRRRYDDSLFGPGLSWKHPIGYYGYPWQLHVRVDMLPLCVKLTTAVPSTALTDLLVVCKEVTVWHELAKSIKVGM